MWQPPPPPPQAFVAYVDGPIGMTACITGTAGNDRISILGSQARGITLIYNGERILLDPTVRALNVDCGPGDDLAIVGTDVPTVLRGGSGDDVLYTDPDGPEDTIMGGPGNDTFLGNRARDLFIQDNETPVLREPSA